METADGGGDGAKGCEGTKGMRTGLNIDWHEHEHEQVQVLELGLGCELGHESKTLSQAFKSNQTPV